MMVVWQWVKEQLKTMSEFHNGDTTEFAGSISTWNFEIISVVPFLLISNQHLQQ